MSNEIHRINGVDYTDLRVYRPVLSFNTVLQGLTVDSKWIDIGNIVFTNVFPFSIPTLPFPAPIYSKENTMHPDVANEPATVSKAKTTWQETVDVMINEYQKKYDDLIRSEHRYILDGLSVDAKTVANQAEEYAVSIKTLRDLIQRMEVSEVLYGKASDGQ